MTRDEAIELLELMKQQQHDEDRVAPLDPEKLAMGYVRVTSQRRGARDDGHRNGRAAGGDCEAP